MKAFAFAQKKVTKTTRRTRGVSQDYESMRDKPLSQVTLRGALSESSKRATIPETRSSARVSHARTIAFETRVGGNRLSLMIALVPGIVTRGKARRRSVCAQTLAHLHPSTNHQPTSRCWEDVAIRHLPHAALIMALTSQTSFAFRFDAATLGGWRKGGATGTCLSTLQSSSLRFCAIIL
jgi:hypothetical protein